MGMSVIPERLVRAREFIGHNRKSFAKELNIPYRTITNYENGSREPGSNYLIKVAVLCDCTTDWLLGLSDEPRNNVPHPVLLDQENDPIFESLRINYEELNAEGREKLADYADDLVQSNKYK